MMRQAFLRIFVSAVGLAGLLASLVCGQTTTTDQRSPSVGVVGKLSSLVLPGTKLKAKPLIDDTPMIVQIANAFKHGDGFRYDLTFQGMEPGKYDLRNWLQREDGSSVDDLPSIEVQVVSLLSAGVHPPHELESGILPGIGGYRSMATLVVAAWVLGLLCLIFLRLPKSKDEKVVDSQPTLADLLKDRLQAVADGRLQPDQYAEMERVLFGMWRRRLALENVPAEQAMREVRQHPDAGPLMRQLEQWMHSPRPRTDVDLETLLEPYQCISASELDPGGRRR